MKRILFFVALVLGVVSCQSDLDDFGANVGGEQEVIVNVSLPEETRANSAVGAVSNVDLTGDYTIRYIFQVYNSDFTESKAQQVKYSDDASVSFPVRLVPGRDYNFVVWADIVENANPVDGEKCADLHYNTANLANITLNDTWEAMDETRDAYTVSQLIKDFKGTEGYTLTLKRPFAKLRVITTDMAELLGLELENATVTYSTPHYNTFNALESKAVGDSKNRNIEHKDYTIKDYETTDGKVLFTDYFFAENDVVKFNLSVAMDDGKTVDRSFTTDIHVKRNHLTTLIGDILTEGNNITVNVEEGFAGESGIEDGKTFAKVDTAEELQDAINKGIEKITLEGDIDLNDLFGISTLSTRATASDVLTVAAGKNITLDLNGKTISYTKECDGSYSMIENKGTLTIGGNGAISFTDTSVGGGSTWGSYTICNYGTLVVNDATIEHLGCTGNWGTNRPTCIPIQNYTGKVTVNSGVISSPMFRSLRDFTAGGEIIINGGEFKGQVWMQGLGSGSSSLTINGGEFAPTAGYDGSSIFITNGTNDINVAVTGGFFNTKIGCNDANKAGVKGCIVGGTFTANAIENTNAALIANGHAAIDNGDDTYTVVNLRASEVEIYGLTLKPNGNNSKIVVNDKEGFLNITKLFNNWTALFTDGNGTTYTNYAKGAGADYYYSGRWTVSLEADIDLNNDTISSVIIKHPVSAGSLAFEGNDHTIKNAKIVTDTATENEAGLFATISNCGFKDLKLDNIHVTGSNVGNSTAGVLAGSNNVTIDNITITNSSVEGGKYTGGVVGYGYTDVTNCTLTNVSVKGGYKLGGLIGYICATGANTGDVTGNALTNCSVDGIGGGIYAGGKSEYIIGMLVGNYNCNGTCQDNVVYDMTTTATKVIGKIEAGKVVNESNNIVTYVVENYEELKAAVINGGKIEFANDITVDEWIMFSERLNISSGQIITVDELNVTIDGKGHTLTVNAIESAGNGNSLFYDASVLNISNLTLKYADGLNAGALGMDSGVIKDVHFVGGGNAISPGNGEILVEECIFDNNGAAIYFEQERDNLTVTGCTFNQKADKNVILLRGDVEFTDNIINSGRTVNVVSGSPVVTGNNFNNVRFKVYGAATATISNNIINNLEFDGNPYASTFTNNTLSSEAQAVLNAAPKAN